MNQLGKPHGSLGVSPYDGIISPAYFVAGVEDAAVARFVHHLLRTRLYISEYERRGKFMPPSQFDISWEQFRTIDVTLPPRPIQQVIADYLDTETTRVDALIAKKRRLIEVLDERSLRAAFETITGAAEEGPRKSSSNDWLGAIPTTWEVAPVSSRYSVQLGRMLNAERASAGEMRPYLRNINVRWDVVDVDDVAEMDFPADERRKYVLRSGDLVICEGGAGVGRAAVWRAELAECYFQKSVQRVRATGPWPVEWLLEYLRVSKALNAFIVEGNLATIPHLTAEQLRVHRVPFPTPEKARELLRRLNDRRAADQHLQGSLARQIGLLVERRQALITAAVTGELEMAGAAG